MERHGYLLGGQVQGVGFRPFVYRTARRLGLTGVVGNTSQGVVVEVQGETAALAAFAEALATELPPLARITEQRRRNLPPEHGEASFRIAASESHGGHMVLVSPDVATCDACLADMRDPAGRRYGYAFTNCTDCGPRYTITRSIPYDRVATTMSCFSLCPECQAEYEDPANRRFHAQPNACPVCGPRLRLLWGGRDSTGTSGAGPDTDAGCLRQAAEALAQGRIVAIKGLGGFLLACDARNEGAVAELRRRKRRPHKSLAVMVADIGAARCIARLTPDEEAVLLGAERPVLVALRRLPPPIPGVPGRGGRTGRGADDGGDPLPAIVVPDLDSVGIMLPYTPLHHLLLEAFGRTRACAGRAAALIMTSGNAGGEPISLGNREALARLADIADLFLVHNRDILIRADDSVVRLVRPLPEVGSAPAKPQRQFLRRARGFVPRPVDLAALPGGEAPCIFAVGGELKNALCLTRGRQAFVSQHIGDLKNPETLVFFRETAAHFAGLLEVEPAAVVRDLHPDYLSSSFAEEYGRELGVPVLRMQHHFAHVYGVLAEHRHTGPSLGLALDGTGFGEDGTIWGGELLFVRPEGVCRSAPSPGRRLGRLAPFPLPGGEMAIREPWRLVSAFLGLCDENELSAAGAALLPPARRTGHAAIVEMVRLDRARGEAGFLPWTSSCGRLFDAVSSLLGLCDVISYEGQAAIRLEQAQDRRFVAAGAGTAGGEGALPVRLGETADGLLELDTRTLFLHLLKWRIEGRPVGELARRFHLGLVEGLAEMAAAASRRAGVTTVALSGGVLHNVTMARHLPAALRRRGLLPLVHLELPPGDGGLCLGQADWARRALRD